MTNFCKLVDKRHAANLNERVGWCSRGTHFIKGGTRSAPGLCDEREDVVAAIAGVKVWPGALDVVNDVAEELGSLAKLHHFSICCGFTEPSRFVGLHPEVVGLGGIISDVAGLLYLWQDDSLCRKLRRLAPLVGAAIEVGWQVIDVDKRTPLGPATPLDG
eukprot:scaffold566744_cov41-Prasinocladus_malaysianus.AAC.1